tara:strand:+ start:1195 stop:1674 length:480 start_codon:yes stop_codon:yes gene_type:complete
MEITRITLEESKNYIPCDDDFKGEGMENAVYFSLSPSHIGDGWEDIKYYTARKVAMYVNRDGDYNSWVYIMSNSTMPGYYKIGYTKKNPDERAKQISNATGVAAPMEVEWAFHCYSGFDLEQEVHSKLKDYRVSNQREFFQLPLEEAKEVIEELGKRYL